mgnify:CR=1 FL=1
MTHLPDLQALLAAGLGPELHWFPEDVPLEKKIEVLKNLDSLIKSCDKKIVQAVLKYGEKIKKVKLNKR